MIFDRIEKNSKYICRVILRLSLLLKVGYAFLMQFDISAHDLWDVSDWHNVTLGNLGYIQYLYQYKELPIYYGGQFYHPPFFYALSALVMDVVYGMTGNVELAFEIIQILNSVVAFLVSYACYRLFLKLNISGIRLVAATAFVSSFPLLYNMGACINNDCLVALFCVLTMLFAVKWSETKQWSDIILTAVCLALGMLTKTSAGLMAVGPALLFLYSFFKADKQEKLKKLLPQYLVFGLISVPLGLSWVIRQKITFGIPFSYIMPLEVGDSPYIASLSPLHRLGLPTWAQMTTTFTDFNDPYNYSNIWGQILQSTMFDEMIFNSDTLMMKVIGIICLWLLAAIMIMLTVRFVMYMTARGEDIGVKLLLGGIFFTLMGSFIVFCFQYTYICTMHTRYIFAIFPILLASYGLAPRIDKKAAPSPTRIKIERAEFGLISVYGILCVILYLIPYPF